MSRRTADEQNRIPVADAVESVFGVRPKQSTIRRWRVLGICGIKLESVQAGRLHYSSIAEVRRFKELTDAALGNRKPTFAGRKPSDEPVAQAIPLETEPFLKG